MPRPADPDAPVDPEGVPPLLGSWGRWYALVLALLAIIIGLLSVLSVAYR
jgi:hypothetical protein